jgi:outer membrane protein assembly factor BamB
MPSFQFNGSLFTFRRLCFSLLGLASAGFCAPAMAENWPQWRGPNRDGISHETGIATQFSNTENVVWRTPLPGPAGATPVIWDDHIFLTSVQDDKLLLMALNTHGEVLWSREVTAGNRNVRADEGNFASPSPSTDGTHVWALFGNGVLVCYDFSGREVWRVDLQQRYGDFDIQFGMASTPVLYQDRLYLQLIHTGGAHVIALDKKDGSEVWHQLRASDARDECEQSYASPQLYVDDQYQLFLTHGADYIVAHRLSDGSEVWRCGGLHPAAGYDPTLRFVASPLITAGMIVVPSAKQGTLVSLKPDGHGDITDKRVHYHWRFPTTPDVPSPLKVDDYVYLCRENGNLICLEASTGKELYAERTHRQRHRASPIYADGKIYLTARDGRVTVVKAGPELEILAKNEMGEEISASPAVAGGRLYIRSFEALYAIAEEL